MTIKMPRKRRSRPRSRPIHSLALLLLMFMLSVQEAEPSSCSICKHGSNGSSSFSGESRINVVIDNVLVETCNDLAVFGALLPSSSNNHSAAATCNAVQAYGISDCGCPSDVVDSVACRLCGGSVSGSVLPETNRSLSSDLVAILRGTIPEIRVLHEDNLTCGVYDAILMTNYTQQDAVCMESSPVREYCRCTNKEGERQQQQQQQPEQGGSSALPCPVCQVAFPEKEVVLIRSRVAMTNTTCGDLVSATDGFMTTSNTSQCTSLQQLLETHCGCVIEQSEECNICPDNQRLLNRSHIIDHDDKNSSREFAQLAKLSGGNLTCQALEQASRVIEQDSVLCSSSMALAAAECGGCVPENTTISPEPTQTPTPSTRNNSVGSSNDNDDNGNNEDDRCTLCPYGEPVPFPEREIDLEGIVVPTCGVLDIAARTNLQDDAICPVVRAMAKYCGCRMPDKACALCPNSAMTKPHATYEWTRQRHASNHLPDTSVFATSNNNNDLPSEHSSSSSSSHDGAISCEILDTYLASTETEDSQGCLTFQLRGESCGCPNPRQTVALIVKRVAAALSLLGSLFILQDVLRDATKNTTTFHQILLAIGFFDILGSIAHLLGPIPLPAYSGIPGAIGNDATCRAQGFLVQLGLTSTFFNLYLAVYFWLVICCNWKSSTFERMRSPIYVGIILLGCGYAFGGLPYYTFSLHTCHIYRPPLAGSWFPITFFFTIPLSIVLLGTTIFTVLVLFEVRRRERALLKYKSVLRLQVNGETEFFWTRRVFWKSICYLSAFYVTYPILMVAELKDGVGSYYFTLTWSALFPLQGLWNFFIYFLYRKLGWPGPSTLHRRSSRTVRQSFSSAWRHHTSNDQIDAYRGIGIGIGIGVSSSFVDDDGDGNNSNDIGIGIGIAYEEADVGPLETNGGEESDELFQDELSDVNEDSRGAEHALYVEHYH